MTRLQGAMPSWMTDATAVPANGAAAAFDSPLDPNANNVLDASMNFMSNPTPFDLQAYPNQQLQHRMSNGSMRNASPAFPNPSYQVPSAIPLKRPRPREDSLGASPHQAPGALPASRSQTPQQMQYGNFSASQQPAQHFAQPNPYQHLQHGGSANASPSPIMQNQQFRPPGAGQRVQTASPSPFSPAPQGFGAQMSPSQPDQSERVNTPQNSSTAYMQGLQYNQPFNPYFATPPNMNNAPQQGLSAQQMMAMQNSQQQTQEMARNYQMRVVQQRQAMMQANNIKAQNLHQAGVMGNMSGQARNQQPMQMNASPTRTQQPASRVTDPSQFVKQVASFMSGRGLQINPQPQIVDRRVHLAQLYTNVMKKGGSKKVSQTGAWPGIAADLQFPQAQYPMAPQELKAAFERNLGPYEEAWMQAQQKQRLMAGSNAMAQQNLGEPVPGSQQMSPVKQQFPPGHGQPAPGFPQPSSHPQQQGMMQPLNQAQGEQRPGSMNGFSTPQPSGPQNRRANAMDFNRGNSLRATNSSSPHASSNVLPGPSPLSAEKTNGKPMLESPQPQQVEQNGTLTKNTYQLDPNFEPKVFTLDTYGGIELALFEGIGAEVAGSRPGVPNWTEMGIVDIQALTLSLQSDIHAEVRLALDTLAVLSAEQRIQHGIQLAHCEDLVGCLVDCADSQLQTLTESVAETSADIELLSYEDVIRGWRLESNSLQDVPPFGTKEYKLDRAIERLICITTILRNFSFHQHNHPQLADVTVVKFLATLIRHLGTRKMLLRTYFDTADLMKDLVTFLSNISQAIELPGPDEALALLQFLLSFAPVPSPSVVPEEPLVFSPYQPAIHRYLPPAVDSLAKLLARDEPNRTIYKAMFLADGTSSSPHSLLTRSFALAISPIPENGDRDVIQLIEARKPYLNQGMLAAEVLASLVPGYESGVAKRWLSSEDGFAISLLRMVSFLSGKGGPPPARHHGHGRSDDHDAQSYWTITHRGLAVLRRLAEKSQNPDEPDSKLPMGVLPKKESLLGALLTHNIDATLVRQLCAFAGLEH